MYSINAYIGNFKRCDYCTQVKMKSNNRDKIKPKIVPERKENNKQKIIIKETNIRGEQAKKKRGRSNKQYSKLKYRK